MSEFDPAVIVDGLRDLELDESQPVIYDRPVGLRLGYADPVAAPEGALPCPVSTRTPAAAERPLGTPPGEFLVLDGQLEVNERSDGTRRLRALPGGAHHASRSGR